tara:strand:+ start:8414 stop:8938 length:525 start_codon:yes stop_codon:yes gene_type:complete
MSRTVVALLCLALLGGCAVSTPAKVIEPQEADDVVTTSLQRWLSLQQDVSIMSEAQVSERIRALEPPVDADDVYYYGLLHQQLNTFGAMTQARDTFRTLMQQAELSASQRQLVGILQQYNQSRINGYLQLQEMQMQQQDLQAQLTAIQQEKQILKQKIQALTDLEAAISTRREQ